MDTDMMASLPLNIDDLPSEASPPAMPMVDPQLTRLPPQILIQILTPLTTSQLLPLARVNRRFHDLTLRLIHTRLTDAAWLPEHELILEAYHPSAKISTPYLHCDYLGTNGLQAYQEDQALDFPQLRNLYSRFRPVVQEENRRPRSRYPAEHSSGTAVPPPGDDTASLNVDLDDGEMFSQLCCVTNMVKTGPRRGLFLSHVNINDGVVRVFRRWLASRAAGNGDGDGKEDPILWTDRAKNVGLKFRVRENVAARPALWDADEDPPVSYTLVYEELLVRTSKLLLNVEKSEDQEVASTGKAIVIASL